MLMRAHRIGRRALGYTPGAVRGRPAEGCEDGRGAGVGWRVGVLSRSGRGAVPTAGAARRLRCVGAGCGRCVSATWYPRRSEGLLPRGFLFVAGRSLQGVAGSAAIDALPPVAVMPCMRVRASRASGAKGCSSWRGAGAHRRSPQRARWARLAPHVRRLLGLPARGMPRH